MSLEISEIEISMQVADSPSNGRPQSDDMQLKTRDSCRDIDKEEIVDDCVRRVLEVLHTLSER